jgi:hypothetical protein
MALTLDVPTRCGFCGESHIVKNVPAQGYADWKAGKHIQVALPWLSPDDREMLMTGTCPPCWDSIFEASEKDDVL